MEKVRFTCTEKVLKFKDAETGQLVIMEMDDSKNLPIDQAELFCDQGWGTAEGLETKERDPKSVKLIPKNTAQQAESLYNKKRRQQQFTQARATQMDYNLWPTAIRSRGSPKNSV